jgi:hypothetical protein
MSAFAAAVLPPRATTISAVWPSAFGESAWAPASSSAASTAGFAATAASDIGVAP